LGNHRLYPEADAVECRRFSKPSCPARLIFFVRLLPL
jgi:hypothetical protein